MNILGPFYLIFISCYISGVCGTTRRVPYRWPSTVFRVEFLIDSSRFAAFVVTNPTCSYNWMSLVFEVMLLGNTFKSNWETYISFLVVKLFLEFHNITVYVFRFFTGRRVFSRKMVFLVTDGHSNVKLHLTIPKANALKNSGVEIFVVAVGKYINGIDEMVKVASYPPEHFLNKEFPGVLEYY